MDRRRRIAALIGVIVAMFAAATFSGAASATTYGYVYLVTPTWWGWCPYGSVVGVRWMDTGISQGGDYGDDVVYAKVALYQTNNIVLAVSCSRTTPMGMSYAIYPTRAGQAWYFGYPVGTWHN